MKRQKVKSRILTSIGYSLFRGTLQVEFKDPNKTYDFHNVPVKLYIELMHAPSKTTFFNKYIKDQYPSAETEG